MKIVQLIVDENEYENQIIGVDGIGLVKSPAHEENWLMFNKATELKMPYEVLTEDELRQLALLITKVGEKHEDIIADGYELVEVNEIDHKDKFVGDISSNPNDVSMEDYAGARVRYKYVGPRDNKNRPFCSEMLQANFVYRIEDIQRMTESQANEDFGYYDIFKWRGSYNCRHRWVQLVYKPVDQSKNVIQNKILNDAKRRRNLEDTVDIPQEDTMTTATANNRRVKLSVIDGIPTEIDGVPLFDNREHAHQVAKIMGCKGIHIHKINDKDYYMPCEKHPNTFNEAIYDVPKYARDKACKARKYKEENPDISCGTRVGWLRSNMLCSGDKISRDIISRMASFARHIPEAEKQSSYDDGCALLMLDAWGGKEGIEWAQKKLDQIDQEEMAIDVSGLPPYVNQTGSPISEEFIYDNPCQEGYVAYGTKIKDGREVPNCVPRRRQSAFSYDDDKMEITGAAMIPNKLIKRRDMLGQEYWVYFDAPTIKTLAYQFMKQKLVDATNIEHTNQKAKDTYVVESWLVDDEYIDKAAALGLDYPKGSWVITMKTDDKNVWSEIKKGTYRGFSIEGYFSEKVVFSEEDKILYGIKNIIKKTNDE